MAHSQYRIPVFSNMTIVGEMVSGGTDDSLKVSLCQGDQQLVLYHIASSAEFPISLSVRELERLTLAWAISFSNILQDTVNNAIEEIAQNPPHSI